MIRFIVDSTFGISKEFAEKENIKVVNLTMTLEGITTEEGFEDSWKEFYERLKNSKFFPTSSQPSPQSFIDTISEIYKEDSDAEIIILTIAEYLSGTINSALLATKSFEGKKIFAIDTGAVCACSVMMLEELLTLAKSGKSFEYITQIAPIVKSNLEINFIPSTMEYLKRGGRVNKLAASILDTFKIKPIFKFKNNVISIPKKVLGIHKAIVEAIKLLPQKIKKIYACYIYENTYLGALMTKLKEKFPKLDVKEFSVSPMFGVHVGIGSVGIATLSEY